MVNAYPPRSNLSDSTPTFPIQSPIEGIAVLDNLPNQACIEVTRRLLSTASSLPNGVARPIAVLKAVILSAA
jgi:hypothetical protein